HGRRACAPANRGGGHSTGATGKRRQSCAAAQRSAICADSERRCVALTASGIGVTLTRRSMNVLAGTDAIDALIIGGRLYGCVVALTLARRGKHVVIVEREQKLLARASYNNQARVHQGYHYPRSYLTGLRSAMNFARFVEEFADCIDRDFEHVYAIARDRS